MMVFWKFAFASIFCLAVFGKICASETVDKCPCVYNQQNEGECYSYSGVGNNLQPWPVASDSCLAALGVEERILPVNNFWRICPYPNRTDVDYAEIISLLKNEPDHPISVEIKMLYEDRGIFVLVDGKYVLPETITSGRGVLLNCTESVNFCWSEIRIELEGRKQKMNKFCGNLHDRQVSAWQREQAFARLRLCDLPDPVCEPLSSELQQHKSSGKSCASVDDIVPVDDLPECQGDAKVQSGGNSISLAVPLFLVLVSIFIRV